MRNLPISLISIFMLFLAISLTIITPKSTFLLHPKFLQIIFKFQHILPTIRKNPIHEPPYCLLWMAPFLSGGGYSSEAWSYILALNAYLKKQKAPIFKLRIEHYADLQDMEFWVGLPPEMRNLAINLYQTKCKPNQTLVICHSEPGAWHPPLYETLPCPPSGYGQFKAVVGRTMFETDRVNEEHVGRCNRMDYVWVPTDFHVATFRQSGVDPLKLRKIIQPVDSTFFDPLKVEPLRLDAVSRAVLGSEKLISRAKFVFLSVFKWEHRKGWDVLLRAYLEEFGGKEDGVALCLLTNAYHTESDFDRKIVRYVKGLNLDGRLAPVYVIDGHIAQVDLPRLYKAADAFVLPSRGEGWGRPVVEAMAMALPVIATNWSGPTEYLTEQNGYPLPFDGMSEVRNEPFEGHLWAEPSVDRLRFLMRLVVSNRSQAMAKGLQARVDMKGRFSPQIVADQVVSHLQEILHNLD
ncbi:uncharacterized protein LOC130990119 [Salvia miltiorrhiza]|uniref:uncharacterized protein LOC130990119 n=1 Tax=Salvia miltiorrhiza TaxID=226208 RepID=UPI0025AC143B|nr:uncharacterized protein LOC130990119 [Salvia miltiorrhiza]